MQVFRYVTASGKVVLGEWLAEVKDARTMAKIVARVDPLAVGNFGDCKALRGWLFELRINWVRGIAFITQWWARLASCCFVVELRKGSRPT